MLILFPSYLHLCNPERRGSKGAVHVNVVSHHVNTVEDSLCTAGDGETLNRIKDLSLFYPESGSSAAEVAAYRVYPIACNPAEKQSPVRCRDDLAAAEVTCRQ